MVKNRNIMKKNQVFKKRHSFDNNIKRRILDNKRKRTKKNLINDMKEYK